MKDLPSDIKLPRGLPIKNATFTTRYRLLKINRIVPWYPVILYVTMTIAKNKIIAIQIS